MRQWRVQDVMTTDVITAEDSTPVADLVALLTGRQVSAVPIVDDFGTVLGVVSWADLHPLIEVTRPPEPKQWWRRRPPARLTWPEGTAAGVMNGPPLTIGADASLPAAARFMHQHRVGRLLVVDAGHRLRGIVTRSDLFQVHDRLDEALRDDVATHVLDELGVRPGAVQVTVDDGAVTLTGRTERRTTALAAARMAASIPGVTDVDSQLESDVDDTAPAGGARHPLRRNYLRTNSHRRGALASAAPW